MVREQKIECPTKGCEKIHLVEELLSADKSQELTDECDGCGNKVYVSDNSIQPYKSSFNISSEGDSAEDNTVRYVKEADEERYSKLK